MTRRSTRPSDSTCREVLSEIDRDGTQTDEQIARALGLRPTTIWSALNYLKNNKWIRRDASNTRWERTAPPWMPSRNPDVTKADIEAVRRFITAYPQADDDAIMAETGLTRMQVVDCQKAITDGYIIASL